MSRERFHYIDDVKGAAMLWVVAIHIFHGVSFLDICSAFALPVYFLISGSFHKLQDNRIFLKKKIRSLLFPFVVYELICAVFLILLGNLNLRTAFAALLNPFGVVMGPTWFLLSLFWVSLLFNCFENNPFLQKYKMVKYLLIFLLTVIGFYCIRIIIFGKHVHLPFYMGAAFVNAPIYYLGNQLKDSNLWSRKKWGIISVISGVYIVTVSLLGLSGNVWFNVDSYSQNLILMEINAIGGAMFLLSTFAFINKKIPVLSFIGENSFSFMLLHMFPIFIIRRFFPNCNGLLIFFITMFLVTILIVSKKFFKQHIVSAYRFGN